MVKMVPKLKMQRKAEGLTYVCAVSDEVQETLA